MDTKPTPGAASEALEAPKPKAVSLDAMLKAFTTDKNKEEHGVWVKGPDGVEYLIARLGNPRAQKLAERLMRPHRSAQRKGSLDPKVVEAITRKVMAETILLDWRGLDTPYSSELGERLFEKLPDFSEFIADYAGQMKLFQEEEEEEAQKN